MIAVPSIASFAPYLSLDEAVDATAKAFELEVDDVVGRRRFTAIAFARAVGMYVAKEDANPVRSWAQIGLAFGGRDHSTAMHAHEKIAGELDAKIIATMRAVAKVRAEIAKARR